MDATYSSNSPVPMRPPKKRSWAAWCLSELLVPLTLGLGIGGALAPCGHGQCERQATK